jgi:hypothetical protein
MVVLKCEMALKCDMLLKCEMVLKCDMLLNLFKNLFLALLQLE